jgi:sugar (pentulose or hexulose) kinase
MILVIDLGTQSFRATVLDKTARRVWEWSRAIDTHRDGVIAEQDPNHWRDALFAALAAIRSEDSLASQIRAVTCSATLSGLVCLDAEGHPLRPAILYGDRRPASQLPVIESLEEYRTSGWRAYSGDFLPQLAYLRNEEPQTYAAAHLLLDATGYLTYLLTGQPTLDRYTTFTCYADPTAKPALPASLLQQLGIDAGKLGRVVNAGDSLGAVLQAEVISVSYDSTAAYLGSPLNCAGDALDISGTVTSFGVLSPARIVDPRRRVFSIPYGSQWLVRGSTAMSGGVLEWARQALVDGSFEEFDRLVSTAPPGANGVLFLPYLAGARSPLWEPSASGVFHGLTPQTSRADMARAVYEGLCFSLQHIVATIESCGAPVHTIQLGGGLSRNALLNQMKSNITGKPVSPQQDNEVTTLGSASIAARAIGWLAANESYCTLGNAVLPDPALQQVYGDAFTRYCELASHLFPDRIAGQF